MQLAPKYFLSAYLIICLHWYKTVVIYIVYNNYSKAKEID